MSLAIIIVSTFQFNQNVQYIILTSLSIVLISKINVVTNLKPLNSDNKSINLFLTANLVYLSCSSELKELKISAL